MKIILRIIGAPIGYGWAWGGESKPQGQAQVGNVVSALGTLRTRSELFLQEMFRQESSQPLITFVQLQEAADELDADELLQVLPELICDLNDNGNAPDRAQRAADRITNYLVPRLVGAAEELHDSDNPIDAMCAQLYINEAHSMQSLQTADAHRRMEAAIRENHFSPADENIGSPRTYEQPMMIDNTMWIARPEDMPRYLAKNFRDTVEYVVICTGSLASSAVSGYKGLWESRGIDINALSVSTSALNPLGANSERFLSDFQEHAQNAVISRTGNQITISTSA